jgi:hypothetical protein
LSERPQRESYGVDHRGKLCQSCAVGEYFLDDDARGTQRRRGERCDERDEGTAAAHRFVDGDTDHGGVDDCVDTSGHKAANCYAELLCAGNELTGAALAEPAEASRRRPAAASSRCWGLSSRQAPASGQQG